MNHPPALKTLYRTEKWERFGFYLMLSVFTLCLNQHFHLTEAQSTSIYGTYLALVYFFPIVGGRLADGKLGYRRSVLLGTIFLSMGYFAVAGAVYLTTLPLLYGALAMLVVGNALFKPNISTMVGNLYPQGDPRVDAAFSTFYFGINVGAFWGPLVASSTRNHLGWATAFGVAGVGMLLSGWSLIRGWKVLDLGDQRSNLAAAAHVPLPASYADPPAPPEVERERIQALVIMCSIVMLFWVAFHQNGSTLEFWARDNTDLTLGGLLVGAGSLPWLLQWVGLVNDQGLDPVVFSSVNSLFVLLLTKPMLAIFGWLRGRNLEPSTPAKLGFGMIMTAAAFGVMTLAAMAGAAGSRVSALWLVGGYFIITIGELCLSPMGLSMVTKLAPRRLMGSMMGVWFISTAVGNYLSGFIGRWWATWPHQQFFGMLVISSLAAAGILLLNLRRLRRAMPPEAVQVLPAPPPARPSLQVQIITA